MASYRARMQHLYANDGASGDAGGKATAHDFNLRKFGHRSRPAVLRRSEGTRFSSSSDDEVGGPQGASAASGASNLAWLDQRAATGPVPRLPLRAAKAMAAAFCSASFLFLPAPGP